MFAFYLLEPLSDRIEAALRRIDRPTVSALVDVEFCSVLARKFRSKELSLDQCRTALANYEMHKSSGHFRTAALNESRCVQARNWLESFEVPLRTLDALHLAIAKAESIPIWTADLQLSRAAERFGVGNRLFSP